MKSIRLAMLCVLVTVAMTTTAFAAKGDKEIDFGAGLASDPYGGFGVGWGGNLGGGYEFFDEFTPGISGDTLQLRGDIEFHRWSAGDFGNVTVWRLPVTVSRRYYFPIRPVKNLRVYGQAGLELSFDHASADGLSPSSEVNLGVTPGAGVEYRLNNQFFLTAGMNGHLISDPYLTVQGGLGFLF